jgi:hypothetical protein
MAVKMQMAVWRNITEDSYIHLPKQTDSNPIIYYCDTQSISETFIKWHSLFPPQKFAKRPVGIIDIRLLKSKKMYVRTSNSYHVS